MVQIRNQALRTHEKSGIPIQQQSVSGAKGRNSLTAIPGSLQDAPTAVVAEATAAQQHGLQLSMFGTFFVFSCVHKSIHIESLLVLL